MVLCLSWSRSWHSSQVQLPAGLFTAIPQRPDFFYTKISSKEEHTTGNLLYLQFRDILWGPLLDLLTVETMWLRFRGLAILSFFDWTAFRMPFPWLLLGGRYETSLSSQEWPPSLPTGIVVLANGLIILSIRALHDRPLIYPQDRHI